MERESGSICCVFVIYVLSILRYECYMLFIIDTNNCEPAAHSIFLLFWVRARGCGPLCYVYDKIELLVFVIYVLLL